MITVKSKRAGAVGEYIGRGTPLGNPFVMGRDGTREEVIEKYRHHLHKEMNYDDGRDWPMTGAQDQMARLMMIAESGDLTLLCWCAPEACHGDIIKRYIETGEVL